MIQEPHKPGGGGRRKSPIREWIETIVIALLVALLIRTFVVQVYLVDGPSMQPTLYTGDRLLVNKFIYRIRPPRRGEIVVLRSPYRTDQEWIKRVVALEGESIEVKNGELNVNGIPVAETYKNANRNEMANFQSLTVPPGHVFVMGDNRAESHDSRAVGPFQLSKIDGKAFFMFWPFNRLGMDALSETGPQG